MTFIKEKYRFLKEFFKKCDIFSHAIFFYILSKVIVIFLLGNQDLLLNLETILMSLFSLIVLNNVEFQRPFFIKFKKSRFYNSVGVIVFISFSMEYVLIAGAILSNDYSILVVNDPFFVESILSSIDCEPIQGPLTKSDTIISDGFKSIGVGIGLGGKFNHALIHGSTCSIASYSAFLYATTLTPKSISSVLLKAKPTIGGMCLMAGYHEGRAKFTESGVHNMEEYAPLMLESNFPNSVFGYLLFIYLLICFLDYKYTK